MTVTELVSRIGDLDAGRVIIWASIVFFFWRMADLIPEIYKFHLENKRRRP